MRVKLSEDSPVVSIAEQISEVIIAGFLWLIACIPIITIGPASAALYYTIVKVVRNIVLSQLLSGILLKKI